MIKIQKACQKKVQKPYKSFRCTCTFTCMMYNLWYNTCTVLYIFTCMMYNLWYNTCTVLYIFTCMMYNLWYNTCIYLHV